LTALPPVPLRALSVMHMRITYFEKPSDPRALPHVLRSVVRRFDNKDQAQTAAFKGVKELPAAHTIEIESERGHSIFERWVRDGDDWRRKDSNRT
jgi:hypothetical protein